MSQPRTPTLLDIVAVLSVIVLPRALPLHDQAPLSRRFSITHSRCLLTASSWS